MRRNILLVAIMFCCSGLAVAQEYPKAELFGGYTFQRFEGNNLHGWNASIMASINPWLAIGADFGGSYNKFNRAGVDVSVNMHSAMFGPQFSRRKDKLTTFGRVLVGVTWADASAKIVPIIRFETASAALMVGGGLDIRLSKSLSARVIQADYHTAWAEHGRGDGLRVSAGLVIRFK